tara:strand:- start:483 stop:1196 length:714 start_codon:yes stop_codon:yes gene_type:complete
MGSLALIGKKYIDTILNVDSLSFNETNECSVVTSRLGGIYNFFDISNYELKIKTFEFGKKQAFIINDNSASSRTSFVKTVESSEISRKHMNEINNFFDWAHICYLDDLEDYSGLHNLDCAFSVDFCTNKDRLEYIEIMNKSKIIFDSRERKVLYDNYVLKPPLLLHDEKGIEIILGGKVVYQSSMQPIANLNVNGAGDMYAGFFIQNYFKKDLKDSARCAMLETTSALLQRNINEEV